MNGGKVVLESGITLSDEKDKVVIEISGDAFKNLREITDIYNKGESEEEIRQPISGILQGQSREQGAAGEGKKRKAF